MIKKKITIWGRKFDLRVTFDHYTGEEILKNQKDALKAFLKSERNIAASLPMVKKYCLSHNKRDIKEDEISNIFKYVKPKYLYIVRDENVHTVAIMCNYKFDEEHGIAVVFKNEKISKVGKQDIIL